VLQFAPAVAGAQPLSVIFKMGDDLRQDNVTLHAECFNDFPVLSDL
jgi:hypothetical protein